MIKSDAMKRLLVILLGSLILLSCNKEGKQDWGGMEHFDFRVSGKVTDSNGEPISGIQVSSLGSSVKTSSDGNYLLEGSGGSDPVLTVSFADVDGNQNGGQFTGTSIEVVLDSPEGAHGPYLGLFSKSDVNVSLALGITPMPDTDIPL